MRTLPFPNLRRDNHGNQGILLMIDTGTLKEQADRFNRASDEVKHLSWPEHHALVVSSRKDGGERFETLRKALEDQYGYLCASLPLPGYYDEFCDDLKSDLDVLDLAFDHIRRQYSSFGRSSLITDALHLSRRMNALHVQLPELTCSKIPQNRQRELNIDESRIMEGYAFHKSLLKTIELKQLGTVEVKHLDTADTPCL